MQHKPDAALAQAQLMTHECLGVRTSRLHRLVSRRFEQALRPLDLSLAQLEVLSVLVLVGEPVRPAFVADQLSVERSTMSRNLSLMQTRGLVRAAETSPSGRSMTVGVTPAGRRLLTRARTAWASAQGELSELVGPQAVDVLDGWLASIGASEGARPA